MHNFELEIFTLHEQVFLTANNTQLMYFQNFLYTCLLWFYFAHTTKFPMHAYDSSKFNPHKYVPKTHVPDSTAFHPPVRDIDLLTWAPTLRAPFVVPRCLDYLAVKGTSPHCHTKNCRSGYF